MRCRYYVGEISRMGVMLVTKSDDISFWSFRVQQCVPRWYVNDCRNSLDFFVLRTRRLLRGQVKRKDPGPGLNAQFDRRMNLDDSGRAI